MTRPALSRDARASFARVNAAWWHFAATTSLARGSAVRARALQVNAGGTARLLQWVRDSGRDIPFFHLSTAFVAGRQRGRVYEEPLEHLRFRNPYEESKAAAERKVLRFFGEGGRGAVFRPSIVVSREIGAREQLPDLCRRALLLACDRGEREVVLRLPSHARVDLVALDWVVRAMAAIAERGQARNGVYHITSPEATAVAALMETIASRASFLSIRSDPAADPHRLPPASRFLDRVLDDVRDYFVAEQIFDRTQAMAALPAELASECFDTGTALALQPEPALAGVA